VTEVEKKVVEKKVVSRNVAIALGIIVIILLVGLVGALAYYTSLINSKDNTISTLTNQNNQLNTWLNGNKTACMHSTK
jgi:predicted PurR-regulated permease PerM